MKNRTLIHVRTLVWALALILLVSSTIGTTVWAKPAKPPGKPEPPPPETATFRIFIGIDGEDVVLTQPESFDVVTTLKGWYPAEKGKPQSGYWGIPAWEDRDGYYTMQPVYSEENATFLTDFYHGETAQLIGLEHHWSLWPTRQENFWHIGLNWTADFNEDAKLESLILDGYTDRGPELEGSYNVETDMWTVTFTTTNACFAVGWCEGSTCWLYWCGYLEFTVKIQRIRNA